MACPVICQKSVFAAAAAVVVVGCCYLSSSSGPECHLLSRFLSTVTASSNLCFSFSNSYPKSISHTVRQNWIVTNRLPLKSLKIFSLVPLDILNGKPLIRYHGKMKEYDKHNEDYT
jgi:hypothetical protein